MAVGTRTILMRIAAVVFVGLVPALCFSILWRMEFLASGKALVYGPVLLGSVACVSYALFESRLRRHANVVIGVLGTAAMVALVWAMLLPIAVWLSPGSISASPLGELAILGVVAAMPLCTAVTLFAWARRASRSAAADTNGRVLISMMAGISVSLLAPILTHTTVSHCDHRVTRAILRASDEEGRQLASDVGAWKHLASWRELERAVMSEWGHRGAGSDGPTAPAGPRASYLSDCYVRITGRHARNW